MTERRLKVGRSGEKAAREFLENLGYEIITANYRCKLGEIDIVAREGDTIIFVEVRTKTGSHYGRPEESITPGKARRLFRLAQYYLQANCQSERPSRIDLVAVTLNSSDYTVTGLRHIKNILSG